MAWSAYQLTKDRERFPCIFQRHTNSHTGMQTASVKARGDELTTCPHHASWHRHSMCLPRGAARAVVRRQCSPPVTPSTATGFAAWRQRRHATIAGKRRSGAATPWRGGRPLLHEGGWREFPYEDDLTGSFILFSSVRPSYLFLIFTAQSFS